MNLLHRRRTMAGTTGGSPLPVGCIFFAPMTEADLTDHVSGTTPTTESTGTATWNEATHMWQFTASGAKTGAIYFDLQSAIINLSTEDCTVVLDMIEEKASGNNWFAPLKLGKKDFNTYPNQFYLAHIFFVSGSTMQTTRKRYATIWHAKGQKCDSYLDGVQTDSNRGRTITAGANLADCIHICFLPTNNSYYRANISNVYIFNRVLSTAEIAAL